MEKGGDEMVAATAWSPGDMTSGRRGTTSSEAGHHTWSSVRDTSRPPHWSGRRKPKDGAAPPPPLDPDGMGTKRQWSKEIIYSLVLVSPKRV